MDESFIVDVDDDGSLLVFSNLTGNFMIRLTDELLDDDEELNKALNIAALQEMASRLIETSEVTNV